ncbi:periplasmic flagellar collar protein FlcA [Treponema sp.]|uniref:periplasmic flagellar collar protein FlcA n=1 Tax=Treponema sp. TaxID=166 RepID=UPI00388D2758
MPGLNQLKTFSEDIRDVGDEVKLRAQRGEKPVSIPLPSGISEEDDSEDFIIGIPETASEEEAVADESPDNFETEDTADITSLDNLLEPQISADEDALADFLNDSLEPSSDIFQTSENVQTEQTEEKPEETPLEDLDLESLLQSSSGETDSETDSETVTEAETDGNTETVQDFSDIDALGEINLNEDIPVSVLENDGSPAQKEEEPVIEQTEISEPPVSESQALENLGDLSDLAGMDSFDMDSSSSSSDLGDLGSFDIDSLISDTDTDSDSDSEISAGEEPSASAADSLDFNEDSDSLPDFSEIPDASTDVPDFSEESASASEEVSIDSFDTSAMEGVDFAPTEPPSPDEFPVTGEAADEDDFILDSSFEIPGFSDTETADLGKKRPLLDTVDFSKGKEDRPKNSLTDDEYVQFKKNLANYPLNLRIAIEDFISRDEFTDEAVFEIIEKVLKKTSARQLATQLEKILDVSINIPRDFERRSFAEYEAYKQSFQYQLKNRIIPAAIVGVILCFVCFGLFKAGVHFIYKPVMANIHYKQGYTLLQENEFPQSEQEFKTAVSYRPVKKWFFKYAEGYRVKKQFDRAAMMYKNILAYFNHDKQAGLDYAAMELYDRANYERAEEITRREVLDYHINDADGILMLGDVFLEWAEVDNSKYELAKQYYLDLIQRYGSNNLYLSRMLRYNIRTDKLREVLSYKNMFYQTKQDRKNLKNLSSEDWTELSGYLLEKLYGTLSKNDEYLRTSIEDVLAMLNLAVKSNPENPLARYNLSRYFVYNGYTEQAKAELEKTLELFDAVSVRTKKNVYRQINASRILGELYADAHEYLKAQTVYTKGINLYNYEHEVSDFEGDLNTGKLFADMGDLDYFISGELDDALYNYEKAIEIKNDTPSINFRVGAIYYGKKDYDNALTSFIKVAEKEPKMPNVLLSLGNVLSLRGDNFAAESYYSNLLSILDTEKAKVKYLTPQNNDDDYEIVDLYLKANNNLGVTLYRLAKQTGNSDMNAQAMVRLSDSIRAYDSLTRNPQTMIRMEGSNLAAQNSKYITHPYPDFEPAIYTDIPRILNGDKIIE